MILLLTGLAAAATLSGVVRSDDGAPLAGATVQVWDSALRGAETAADADGAFTFTDLPPGRYRLRATPSWRDNHVPRFLPDERDYCDSTVVTLEADVTDLAFALPAGATLAGLVTDAQGEPVAGKVIWALGADADTEGWGRPALSAPDGSFLISGIDAPPDGEGDHALYIDGDDAFPVQFYGPTYDEDLATPIAIAAGADRSVDDWTVLPGITVSGTVTGPAGPIADTDVHVYATSQVVTVQTDAAGRYTATGIPPGEVLAWASPDGHALTYYPDVDRPTDFVSVPNEGQSQAGVDLHPPYEAVLPLLLLGDGAPLPGVQVLLYNDAHTVGQGNRTGEDGRVRLTSIYGGPKELYAWAGDLGFAEDWIRDDSGAVATIDVAPGEEAPELTLHIPPAAELRGTLTDEAGQPIVGAEVVASRADGELVRGTSEEGGAYVLSGLTPGDWLIQAHHSAFCPNDPGYVTVYYPQTVDPDAGEAWTITADEHDTLDLILPNDDDHDQMGDPWEVANALDPRRDDSYEDPDGDGFPNLYEYRWGTDPNDPSTLTRRGCGCDKEGSAAFLLALLPLIRRRRRA